MKIDQLKEIIKKTVQQEVRAVLKNELRNQLAEILVGKSQQSSKVTEITDVDEIPVEETIEEAVEAPAPKKFVRYTSNDVLNQILNETKGGVPREGEMVSFMGDGYNSAPREQINEVKVPDAAPKEVKGVYKALTRDYRSLMKAVDNKRNK